MITAKEALQKTREAIAGSFLQSIELEIQGATVAGHHSIKMYKDEKVVSQEKFQLALTLVKEAGYSVVVDAPDADGVCKIKVAWE